MSRDEFSTAIKLPVFIGESGQREQFTDWMLEFKAVAGVKGVEQALRSEFEKELPSSDSGWETYESDGVTLGADGKKHRKALEMNAKAMHLLVASVKGVTCRNIINKEKQADSNFITGKAHKVISELENRFSPNDRMAGTEMLMKLNKIRLKNANENPLQMIERIEKLKITYASQSKKLTDEVIVDHIFNVCGKVYPEVLSRLDYAAKKAGTNVDYQDLIDELHCSYRIRETSRKKLDNDEETETDVALLNVNF